MNNKSFDSKRIALGYAKRPWLHKSVIEQLVFYGYSWYIRKCKQ